MQEDTVTTTQEHMRAARGIGSELMELGRVSRLQSWDQETMMPPKGAVYRARQRATIQGLMHERLTRSEVGTLLAALDDAAQRDELDEIDRAIVRELRREYDLAVKLPNDFVREMATAATEGVEIWRRARQESRFSDFAPALEHLVRLARIEADYLGYADHPYDALLDRYEPGLTVATLTPLFATVRQASVALLERIRRSSVQPNVALLRQDFDLTQQWAVGEQLLRTIGFDFEAGRIDRTTHPFATGFGPGDVRLTTRQSRDNLAELVFGNLHEGGHGLYEQGIDPDLADTLIGQYVSLGIHESQSRLWENCVGRDRPFWTFAYPLVQAVFPTQLGRASLDEFVLAINRVEPSLIRVEADEVTYNLHIILRYEIERQLMANEIKVRDLPEVWNSSMQEYLGVTPPDDRLGVLQDTHWAFGGLGYFPTYTLGNVYAAQLWAAVRTDQPDLDQRLAQGDTAGLLTWMRERIHRAGRLYQPAALIERVTGAPPDAHSLIRYLDDKFGRLYELA
jgi:carboxypeptidase Taq